MVLALVLLVSALHLAAAALVVAAKLHWPMVLGFAGLAYALGLRHGFDADHIVAIDSTTRQLLARRRDATATGFCFSLGHSTVVLVLALWIAHATQKGAHAVPLVRALGSGLGLATSSVFMFLMAVLNAAIFRDTLSAVRRSETPRVASRPIGLSSRVFGRALAMVDRSSKMYVVGVLFGLGFDTATEIALLAISATAGARALPTAALLALPVAFAAGMALVDTAEGLFMVRAYAWAQYDPGRRARYNLVITGFTAVAAATIGAMELSNASWFGAPATSMVVGACITGAVGAIWMVAAIRARVGGLRTLGRARRAS